MTTHCDPNTGLRLLPEGLERCAACGSTVLEVVSDGEASNFLCHRCFTCWHMELGYVHRVEAATCPGCAYLVTCLLKAALDRAKEN